MSDGVEMILSPPASGLQIYSYCINLFDYLSIPHQFEF